MKRAFPFVLMLFVVGGCHQNPHLTSRSPEAIAFYDTGLKQYEQFSYSEARASFESALTKDSTFAMAWLRLGLVHNSVRDEARANSCVDRAMALAPNASEREQLFIRMWYYRLRFNTAAAAATADSLASLYPDEKEVYLFRGNIYELSKNFDAAIKCYQRAVQVDTGYALAVMSLGYAYSTTGDQEKAIAQMQRYIQLAPKDADPRASYADILMRAGRFDEALGQYRESLALKPDYWYSIQQIGSIDAMKGMLNEAEQQYHKSFSLLPSNRQLEATETALQGKFALLRGKTDEAAGYFQKSLQIDTLNLDAAVGYVLALARSRRIVEAEEVLQRIHAELGRRDLLTSPYMAGYYLACSIVNMHNGDLVNALVMCDSGFAYSTTQGRAAIYRQMAETNLRQKAFDDGLSACEEGLALTPNSPDILLTLVRIYAADSDHRMTREIGGRLLEFWKNADADYAPRNEVARLLSHQVS